MSPWIRNVIVVASLFLIFSDTNNADAHLFRRLFNRGCNSCYYPQHGRCGHRCKKLARRYFRRCAPVTSCCPGVCTPPPPRICYQDIICTEYRMVPQTRNVPVTTYRQVTVDEGCWQRVWVPKMVTKQIPQTCYRRETTYVRQPYQVRKRVPVMAPQSTCTDCMNNGLPSMISPSPTIIPSTPSTPSPTPMTVPTPTPMSSTSLDLGAYPTLAPTVAAQPAVSWGTGATTSYASTASVGPALPPSPAMLQVPQLQTNANSSWQTIPSLNATPATTAYDDSPSGSTSARGAFRPAPSAATVWNTPRRQRLN
ncbi:hypothetical protein [Gimesia panareensis]|uniref:Uncharacterized protein n=1 Tax=Gimesia panareensis TaxID=2527978 RepID=A0A518A1J9_9PLAN|nr:hypothetical protein [Gimesia panareensis]QDT25659.1 hypothetical protein Enr10x_09560 [Gimesia panareensis]QDU48604.1 hypothetical protein Pan110_09190 [Gimesia panareensis]QDV18243.1 hypothetical protein Pan153_29000 [Gimesia panareensis]